MCGWISSSVLLCEETGNQPWVPVPRSCPLCFMFCVILLSPCLRQSLSLEPWPHPIGCSRCPVPVSTSLSWDCKCTQCHTELFMWELGTEFKFSHLALQVLYQLNDSPSPHYLFLSLHKNDIPSVLLYVYCIWANWGFKGARPHHLVTQVSKDDQNQDLHAGSLHF